VAKDEKNISNEKSFINIGIAFCLFSLAIGSLSIIYQLIIQFLGSSNLQVPWQIWGHKSTIITLLFTGTAIWFHRNKQLSKKEIWISRALVYIVVVLIVSIIILLNIEYRYIFGFFDKESYKSLIAELKQTIPIRSVIGILLSFSILYIDTKHDILFRISEYIGYILILFSLLNIYGYIFQLSFVEQVHVKAVPLSLFSSVMVFFQSSAIIFIRPFRGSMKLLIGENPVRIILIRFFALLAPLILGFLETLGENAKLFSEEFGKSMLATFSFALTMSLLGVKAQIQYNTKKQREKYNNRVKKERKRLLRLLKLSPTIINIVDVQKDELIFTNAEEKDFFDSKEIEKYSKLGFHEKILKIIHPDDQKKEKENWEKATKLEKGKYVESIYRVGDKDNHVWYLSRRYVYKMTDGKVQQILSNAIDITEKQERIKKIEEQKKELVKVEEKLKEANERLDKKATETKEELIESNKRYKGFLENSFDALAHFDFTELCLDHKKDHLVKSILDKFNLVEINNAMLQLLGYDKNEKFDNEKWLKVWVDSDESKYKIIKEFIDNNYKLESVEATFKKKDETEFTAIASLIGVIEENYLKGCMLIVEEK